MYLCTVKQQAEIAQLVEHDLAKVGVASSSLVFRSKSLNRETFFIVHNSIQIHKKKFSLKSQWESKKKSVHLCRCTDKYKIALV